MMKTYRAVYRQVYVKQSQVHVLPYDKVAEHLLSQGRSNVAGT